MRRNPLTRRFKQEGYRKAIAAAAVVLDKRAAACASPEGAQALREAAEFFRSWKPGPRPPRHERIANRARLHAEGFRV